LGRRDIVGEEGYCYTEILRKVVVVGTETDVVCVRVRVEVYSGFLGFGYAKVAGESPKASLDQALSGIQGLAPSDVHQTGRHADWLQPPQI
jgi:hypothetical protein